MLRAELPGQALLGDPRAYHLWAGPARALAGRWFRRRRRPGGVAVTPASAFAATPGLAPNGVRIAFSSPDVETMRQGARILAGLLAQGPEGLALTE